MGRERAWDGDADEVKNAARWGRKRCLQLKVISTQNTFLFKWGTSGLLLLRNQMAWHQTVKSDDQSQVHNWNTGEIITTVSKHISSKEVIHYCTAFTKVERRLPPRPRIHRHYAYAASTPALHRLWMSGRARTGIGFGWGCSRAESPSLRLFEVVVNDFFIGAHE